MRNKLIGRVPDVEISGLVAQITLSIDGQRMTSIITADATRELRLKKGQIVAALIDSNQVIVLTRKAVAARLNRGQLFRDSAGLGCGLVLPASTAVL